MKLQPGQLMKAESSFKKNSFINSLGINKGSFYGAVRKLTFLKKLILILMFDSFLNCWLLINDQ